MSNKLIRDSKRWVIWRAFIKPTTCDECFSRDGKIYSYDDLMEIGEPQLHPNCGCWLDKMKAIKAGEATDIGINGADWWVKYLQMLPDYYIIGEDAKNLGWISEKGNLAEVLPGFMIFGGVYENRRGILPQKEGRVWYEADINYYGGYRNKQRLVFSNDGLVFVTYDHYETFYEIIGEDE